MRHHELSVRRNTFRWPAAPAARVLSSSDALQGCETVSSVGVSDDFVSLEDNLGPITIGFSQGDGFNQISAANFHGLQMVSQSGLQRGQLQMPVVGVECGISGLRLNGKVVIETAEVSGKNAKENPPDQFRSGD